MVIGSGVADSQCEELANCGEQEFLADPTREGYTCEMSMLPKRIRLFEFLVLFFANVVERYGRWASGSSQRNEKNGVGALW